MENLLYLYIDNILILNSNCFLCVCFSQLLKYKDVTCALVCHLIKSFFWGFGFLDSKETFTAVFLVWLNQSLAFLLVQVVSAGMNAAINKQASNPTLNRTQLLEELRNFGLNQPL